MEQKDRIGLEPGIDRLETPDGILYRPQSGWVQIPLLVAAFFGGPLLGTGVGRLLGDLSDNAQIFLYLPYVFVFFLGYALWGARLNAIAFEFLGKSLFKVLFTMIIRRRKPGNIEEIIPSREKLLKMMVRAQKAGNAFWIVSLPIAMLSALAALLIQSGLPTTARCLIVAASILAWGWLLGYLARRGFLPMMEEG